MFVLFIKKPFLWAILFKISKGFSPASMPYLSRIKFSFPICCILSTNLRAISSNTNTSSFIAPVNARFKAHSSSSNFGHNIPGVSNKSILPARCIHCLPFVTPGIFPVFALFFLANEFISVDLPTFGMPTIIALIVLFNNPLFLYLSTIS